MFRKMKGLGLALLILLGIGCTTSAYALPTAGNDYAASATRVITYNGQTYTVPLKTDKIVIVGAMEAMEDALVLNFTPKGAIQIGGEFPALFSKITVGVKGIGEKMQPNLEVILKLKPDIILSSTKFPAETNAKLEKIATTIPVSHISTDWLNNLKLLANLTGKQQEATQEILKYQKTLALAKANLAPKFKDKKVVAMRVRAGNLFIYPKDVFFNPSLYSDLGATVPEEVKLAKAQQNISLEKFSEINPDYLFIQFSADENKDTPKVFEELQKNPIWKSLKAVKSGNVYVNLVDPLVQGGTAYSKIAFIEALLKTKLYTSK